VRHPYQYFVSITAVVCITVLEVIALQHNIDGTLLSLALTLIGGVAGYNLKKPERR
jgi:hypothetical protein